MRTRVLVAAIGMLMLAGCGAGQEAQTARTLPSIAGVSADADGIAVRNAVVPFSPTGYPAGGEAPIQFAVANNGQAPVQLTETASEAASGVTLESAVPVGAEAPDGGATSQVALVPGELVTVVLRLTGLTEALNGTSSVPVTLTFDNGTVLPLVVPMAPPEGALPREAPVIEEEAEH